MSETVELKSAIAQLDELRMHGGKTWLDAADFKALKMAISALTRSDPAVRDRVKPLEWQKPPACVSLQRAETIVGTYRVWTHHEANGAWFWELRSEFSGANGSGTKDQCFNDAQADYEQRILSALEPRTSPPEPASGWMTMDSAPKDGTEFQAWIVAASEGWEPRCRINPDTEAFEIWGRIDYDADGWSTYPHVTATHWQPLPPPPAKEPQ